MTMLGSMRVRTVLEDLRTTATMPRVRVVVSRGHADEESLLREFRRPHPRYRVIRSKAVGVARLPLDGIGDVDSYVATKRYARRRVRRAARLGYIVRVFEPDDRRNELLVIHKSIPERQGRPMDSECLDPLAAYEAGPNLEYLGVFRDEILLGYSKLRYAGDIAAMMRVIGHGDHLENCIRFLLTAEIVRHVGSAPPHTRYVFYDTFLGAGPGLRYFKTQLGFQPHYVRWTRESGSAA
jgi:hypothetical protein